MVQAYGRLGCEDPLKMVDLPPVLFPAAIILVIGSAVMAKIHLDKSGPGLGCVAGHTS